MKSKYRNPERNIWILKLSVYLVRANYASTKSFKLRWIQKRGWGSLLHICLGSEDRRKPDWSCSTDLAWAPDIAGTDSSKCLFSSQVLSWKKIPIQQTFSTGFSICTAGCVMRQFRLRFRLSAECIKAAGALWRPEPLNLRSLTTFFSC